MGFKRRITEILFEYAGPDLTNCRKKHSKKLNCFFKVINIFYDKLKKEKTTEYYFGPEFI